MKGVKKLTEAEKKPDFQYIYLTPKFTGSGWKEGVEMPAHIMVYTDARIAAFAPFTFKATESSRYVLCKDVNEFAERFTISENDIAQVRRRMAIFLKRIKDAA